VKLYKYFESFDLKVLKNNKEDYYYFIGNEKDYQKIKDYYNLLSIEELKKIKRDPIFSEYRYVYTKLGIVDMHSLIDIDELLNEKKIQGPYLILIKDKNIEDKKYKNINDLVNDPFVAIYYNDSFFRNIYCYDLITLKTLFFASLNQTDKNSYGSWYVDRAVSETTVAGKNTLYPIMVYFADGILTSSRDSVKEAARYVWKDFFDNTSTIIKKYSPVDDIKFSITPSNEDDGYVFKKTRYDYDSIFSILKDEINKMDSEIKKIFNQLLLIDNLENLKIILNQYSNNTIIKKLNVFIKNKRIINFNKKTYCDNNDYIYYLLSFITKKLYNQLDAVDVLEKIQESFLNWTYVIRDNSIIPKIKELMKRHDSKYKNNFNVENSIVKFADDLWIRRY